MTNAQIEHLAEININNFVIGCYLIHVNLIL